MSERNEFARAIDDNRNRGDSKISETVEEWFAKKWDIPKGYAAEFFKIQASTYFLLTWPIFEHDVCAGFMDTKKILGIAKKYQHCYDDMQIDSILKTFYVRYEHRYNSNWDSLCHDDDSKAKSVAERVLNRDWNISGIVDKLQFGLYVIYRFRNNIFHGNKSVLEWLNNQPQIEDSVMVLLKLTEFHDKTV